MNSLLRVLLIFVGTLSVALGIVGAFVPVLPTTPFLLLAASCYARSSERFYQWLVTNRWFGESIRNYREARGMPLREKVLTLTVLWLSIGVAVGFAISPWWGRLTVLAIALGVTIHLLRLKTYRPPARPQPIEDGQPQDARPLGRDHRPANDARAWPTDEAAANSKRPRAA